MTMAADSTSGGVDVEGGTVAPSTIGGTTDSNNKIISDGDSDSCSIKMTKWRWLSVSVLFLLVAVVVVISVVVTSGGRGRGSANDDDAGMSFSCLLFLSESRESTSKDNDTCHLGIHVIWCKMGLAGNCRHLGVSYQFILVQSILLYTLAHPRFYFQLFSFSFVHGLLVIDGYATFVANLDIPGKMYRSCNDLVEDLRNALNIVTNTTIAYEVEYAAM